MGSGVWPLAMATRPAIPFPGGPPAGGGRSGVCHVNGVTEVSVEAALFPRARGKRVLPLCATVGIKANRAISTGQLNGLLRFHLRPIDVVVFHGSRRDLVLRRVSRLDAFSGYPVRT